MLYSSGTGPAPPEEWLAHPGSVGKPQTECHIIGPNGFELPVGEPGLIYFAGGRPFEYHNDPEKEAENILAWHPAVADVAVARAAWTSPTRCPASRTASSTSAYSASATGPGTAR